MAKSHAEETVTKKASSVPTKTKEKSAVKKNTVKAKVLKFEPKPGRVLGIYRPDFPKGMITQEASSKGSITEDRAQKLAGKKDAKRLIYQIRKFGKKSGFWNFFRSEKVEGKWIFKLKKTELAKVQGKGKGTTAKAA